MKIDAIERMSPLARRRFLQALATGLATVPAGVRYAMNELAGGTAHADEREGALGTYFVELDLRDQWDQGHVFVAPSLARHTSLRKGEFGDQVALFFASDELRELPGNVFLTDDSAALAPYVDTIAMFDTCMPSLGAIHGHEAANEVRSPGRAYSRGPGMLPLYTNDPSSNFPTGCEEFYGTTPTPASLHNYFQKEIEPTLRNGIAFKGISRSKHTVYHFGAGLAGAELDRIRSKAQLVESYPTATLPRAEDAQAVAELLRRLDRRYLAALDERVTNDHFANLGAAGRILGTSSTGSLALTPDEEAYWSDRVPSQICTEAARFSVECSSEVVKAQIWEQCAFAVKLLESGLTRTVALEFDYMDYHGLREEVAVRTQAQQLSYPLARMIEQLVRAGIYDRTLIAVYTADGSRAPTADSYGDTPDAKNTVILAGGMIRGGYYGDLSVAADTATGHEFAHHSPHPETGAPMAAARGHEARTSSAAVWRTVMRALAVPDDLAGSFPAVADASPLSFLLRS